MCTHSSGCRGWCGGRDCGCCGGYGRKWLWLWEEMVVVVLVNVVEEGTTREY